MVPHWATELLTKLGVRSLVDGIGVGTDLQSSPHDSPFSPPMSLALFANLTAEDLLAEEQEHQATEPSVPSTLGKRASQSRDSDSDDGEENEEQASPRGKNPPSHSDSATPPDPGSLQMDQAIRRTVKRLKLPNEDILLVETFAQASLANPLVDAND